MNVVDSSGWLEYFADGSHAEFFAPAIEDTKKLLVPVICIYEVFERILQQGGVIEAEQHISDIKSGHIIELEESLALSAAKLSVDFKLPMAGSVILATARANHATFWTQDEHLEIWLQ